MADIDPISDPTAVLVEAADLLCGLADSEGCDC